jgi:transcriptional regulator with XRE-family HTH domain
MKVGNKIKGLRIEKGFTTDYMAEKLSISEQTYRKYESDKNSPDINTLEKIASALDKNLIDLLPESILFTNNDQKGGIALAFQSTIHYQSEKLLEQKDKIIAEKDIRLAEKEERIQELKEIIAELKRNKLM